MAHSYEKQKSHFNPSIHLFGESPSPKAPSPQRQHQRFVNVNWDHHEPTSNAKCRGRQTPVLGCEGQEGSWVFPGCQGMCKSPVVECTASPVPWRRLPSPIHVLSATALLPWDTQAAHLTLWPWGWTQSLWKLPLAWYR